MMFSKTEIGPPLTIWAPEPDDEAAHSWLLEGLIALGVPFSEGPISLRTLGNLGEWCCLAIGRSVDFADPRYAAFPANAYQPLENISRPGVDIVWVWLDADDPQNDFAVMHEVKTTTANNLDYADTLLDDYSKLFGADVRFTLNTRLNDVANRLEFIQNGLELHADQMRLMAGLGPDSSPNVSLYPSVVYDRLQVVDPIPKMTAVRTSVIALGWAPDSVHAWAVGLGNLAARFDALNSGPAQA